MSTATMSPMKMIATGGYSLKNYRSAGGEETPRFEAVLTHEGKAIATVSNGGTGGSNMYRFHEGFDGPACKAFDAFIAENRSEDFEPDDCFVFDLICLLDLARKRSVPFVLLGDDFFADGTFRTFGAKATFDEVLTVLRSEQYAKSSPLIFVKKTLSFVPVADVVA